MRDLPSGTVTFLFTDVEGSTRLLHDLGDRYAAALDEHRRVLRATFSAHRGVEVDTQGDAFFAAFARASDAVAAAAAIQSEHRQGPIRVRIGLHTGEPRLSGEGYVGIDLHRGARVCAAGHGGQVLLSQPTRDLVDVDARDLGEHRLKDLLEPQRLFQLGVEEFPPLKTLNWTNLPVQSTPLIGRQRELGEAAALLHKHRLLTLTGRPGTGKTRLALQLAAEVADEFEHVWWVALQEIRDPDLVEPTIAQTVGARNDLAGYLRDRRAFLVLDNVEQVLGCAPRLAELVAGSRNLKLVATSREPLHLSLEQQYPVSPLPEDDAVALFNERASAVRPGFTANGGVADICRRLDGLPLAIELAAVRVKVLPPDALLARLEERLQLLTGGGRDMPERQRTLRATIAWSYDLLDPHEQDVLARLSVFSGWTLDAAEAVCDCELETLTSLVDKSLVREQDGRFSMLETIREYALERLTERDEVGEARSRHAEYFLAGAESNCGELYDDFAPAQIEWFEGEHDNLRAALDRPPEQQTSELELRLVLACQTFWHRRGYWAERSKRQDAALQRAGEAPPALRARLLSYASHTAWRRGDYDRGKDLAERALALDVELGIRGRELVAAQMTLAICEQKLGNLERALEVYEMAAAAAGAVGSEAVRAEVVNALGHLSLDRRDFTNARAYFEESVAICRRVGHQHSLANSLLDLGFVALAEARVEEASATFRESLGVCRAGRLALLVWAVEGLAAVALDRAAPIEATRLLAATTRPRADLGFATDFYPIGEEARERTLGAARATLSEPAFAVAWAEGEALSLEAAAEKAALVK